MYYHVLIETPKSKKEDPIVRRDIKDTDKDTIINDILRPYYQEKEFDFKGYTLKKVIISRFQILASEELFDYYNKLENNQNSLEVFSEADILSNENNFEDVTNDFRKLL